MHEGALLLVAKSAKGLRHFNSYCRMLTFRILSSSLCKVENQENKSVMSGKLFFAVYFAVIFLKRRNYNENFMRFHLYGLYPCLNALIAWDPDLPLNAVIAIQRYLLKLYTSNGILPQTVE